MSRTADTTPGGTAREATAPAKINLFLHVGPRGADGYHQLESLVVFTVFGDRLRLAPAGRFEFTRSGRFAEALPEGAADDLTARAIAGVAEICGRAGDFAVALEKNIPVAAGLGGGSADAGAAIRLVCREWGMSENAPEVLALAGRLGADVPMCLSSRTAWVSGRGDEVRPMPDVAEVDLLLVNPGLPLSTAEVFGAYDATAALAGGSGVLPDLRSPSELVSYLGGQRNDLAGPAQALCPVIGEVLDALGRQDGCRLARMSGSGPTCFAIFDDPEACARAGDAIAAAAPGWWVRATRTRADAA